MSAKNTRKYTCYSNRAGKNGYDKKKEKSQKKTFLKKYHHRVGFPLASRTAFILLGIDSTKFSSVCSENNTQAS
jgi:hypothetical protein